MKQRQKSAAAGALRPRRPPDPRGGPPDAFEPAPQAETRTESACNPSARVPQFPMLAEDCMFKIIGHL